MDKSPWSCDASPISVGDRVLVEHRPDGIIERLRAAFRRWRGLPPKMDVYKCTAISPGPSPDDVMRDLFGPKGGA